MAPAAGLVPLFGPVPGGMEIMVILLIALMLFGLPLILLGGGLYLYRQSQSDRPAGEEIVALRREVERLREEIDRLDGEPGADDRLDDGRLGDEPGTEVRSDDRSHDERASDER